MENESIHYCIPNVPLYVNINGVADISDLKSVELEPEMLYTDMHYHNDIELIYVTEGEYTVYAAGQCVPLLPGQAIFINSGVPHCTKTRILPTLGILVQFEPENFIKTYSQSLFKILPALKGYDSTPLLHVFEDGSVIGVIAKSMINEKIRKLPGYEAYISASVHQLIGYLHRSMVLSPDNSYSDSKMLERLSPVLDYIEENHSKELSLSSISEHFNFNSSYFSRMFKSVLGIGYNEYISNVRVHYAEQLLKSTDLSISSIAMEVGFSSVSYFNKVFKRIKGCSPGDYKNSKLKNK